MRTHLPLRLLLVAAGAVAAVTPLPLAHASSRTPAGPAPMQARPTAYVANAEDDTVTPIDLTTNTPGEPIPVGGGPTEIVVTTDGATAYVANTASDTVTPINTVTNTAGTPIPVGDGPAGLVLNGSSSALYVANLADGTITKVDTTTNTPVTTFGAGDSPRGMILHEPGGGGTLFVTNEDADSVIPIDAWNTPLPPIGVSGGPSAIALHHSGTAFVASPEDDAVIPIDIEEMTAGTPIAVGDEPVDVVVPPDYSHIFVLSHGEGSVTQLDQYGEVVYQVAVGPEPAAIAIDTWQQRAYVTRADGTVLPFDLATTEHGNAIDVGADPRGIAIAYVPPVIHGPEGVTAYVTGDGAGVLTPVDLAAGTTEPPIPVGQLAAEVVVTSDGATAYVRRGNTAIVPVDLRTGEADEAIEVGALLRDIALTPDDQTLYVTDIAEEAVFPIDLATRSVGSAIPVGTNAESIAISPDGARAFVLAPGDHAIDPIDLATGLPEAPIPVGSLPGEIAISPDGGFAYVSDNYDDTLSRVDLGTDSVVATIPLSSAGDIAFAPDGETAYVKVMDHLVQPVRTSDDALLEPIDVLNLISQIAITPDGTIAYVSSSWDASITPIDLATRTVGAPIPAASGASGIAIAPTPEPIPTDPPNAPEDPATPPTPAPPVVGDGTSTDPEAVPVDSLPYTGAGVAMSAAIGAVLLAGGLAVRAVADRRRRGLSSPDA